MNRLKIKVTGCSSTELCIAPEMCDVYFYIGETSLWPCTYAMFAFACLGATMRATQTIGEQRFFTDGALHSLRER